MPRTPFAVSLILAICNETSDYMPTNQAKIVENFMEKLLEKLNPQEVFSKTYDFNNKEKFLSELAYKIFKSNNYYNIIKNALLKQILSTSFLLILKSLSLNSFNMFTIFLNIAVLYVSKNLQSIITGIKCV